MSTEEFLRILGETGAYETPAAVRRRPLPSWIATPLFQAGMLRVYASFLRACRRPGFDKIAIARRSHMVFALVEKLGGTVHMEGFRALDALGGGPAVVALLLELGLHVEQLGAVARRLRMGEDDEGEVDGGNPGVGRRGKRGGGEKGEEEAFHGGVAGCSMECGNGLDSSKRPERAQAGRQGVCGRRAPPSARGWRS